MGYVISFNLNHDGFIIPVNPPAIEIQEAGQSQTYDIAKLGEISVIQNPKLEEISFESIFPAAKSPFVVDLLEEPLEPYEYVEQIEKWIKAKKTIQFKLERSGSEYGIDKQVSIESFKWREAAGAVGDVEYSITLKRYVPYAAKKIDLKLESDGSLTAHAAQDSRPDHRTKPETYTLVAGDTLWKVAQKFLGSGARYPEIQKLNGISDAQLRRLPVGMVIKLP